MMKTVSWRTVARNCTKSW